MLTLTNVFAHFTRRKRDTSDVADLTFIDWMNSTVNEVYTMLLGCDPSSFLASASYTAVTGAQALPAYFGSLAYDGCGVWVKQADGTQTDERLAMTNFGNQTRGYWIDGTNINFTGMDASESVTLKYIPKFRPFTLMADYVSSDKTLTGKPYIPDEDIELLTAGCDVQYAIWDMSGDEGIAAQRFNSLLNSLADSFKTTPKAFSLPDNSSSY